MQLAAIGIVCITIVMFVWIMFRALLLADAADAQRQAIAPQPEPNLHEGEPMKSENPYRDIFTALQGLTFGEATQIIDDVRRGLDDISAEQTLTPEIVGCLDLKPPRQG